MVLRAWEKVLDGEGAVNRYTAIDVGGTDIKYALISGDCRILEKDRIPTEGWLGGPQILDKVLHIVGQYRSRCMGVAISVSGMVDVDSGSVFYAGPTIPNFIGTPFKKAVEEKYHLPCEAENDVNCAGLAEAVLGSARGSSSVLCLTVGTGIGGCFVLNNEVYHGFSGSACEVGYMNLGGPDNFQEMGAASVLSEKVARGKILEKRWGKVPGSGETDAISEEELREAAGYWNGLRIFEAAGQGDEMCIRAIDEMCDVLGRGTADICYVLNPETVVMGGGIMAQKEYLYPRLRAALDRYLIPAVSQHTALKLAQLGNDAGLVGAVLHYRQMRKKRGKIV